MSIHLKHKIATEYSIIGITIVPVSPLVVVPGDQLHEVLAQSNASLGIEDARPAWSTGKGSSVSSGGYGKIGPMSLITPLSLPPLLPLKTNLVQLNHVNP